MDNDIEEKFRLCVSCRAAAKQPLKATLPSWPPATNPWECIHIDFAGPHLGRYYLNVVDPVLFQCPARLPGLQWQYIVNCASNMVFQRQFSATTGSSLPNTNSGSSVRLTLLVTFCHHRTTPNQTDGPNALRTTSTTAS